MIPALAARIRRGEAPRKLLRKVRGIDLIELGDNQLCCGFGGTFSVKFPEVSVPMGRTKFALRPRPARNISWRPMAAV